MRPCATLSYRLGIVPSRSYFSAKKSQSSTQQRLFHATPQRHSQWLDQYYSQTHTLLTGLHDFTGLPWVYTLPLAAFLVRGLLFAPLAIYTHKCKERRIALHPLLNTWRHVLERRVFKEHAALGPTVCSKILSSEMILKQKELNLKLGSPSWKLYLPWLQFPAWLVIIETIRKMSGANEGILGLITKPFKPSTDQDRASTLQAIDSTVVPVENTFSTEGTLWFTDLLVPDPQLIIPFALSGMLFSNVHYQDKSAAMHGNVPTKWSRRLTNTLKILALAVIPLTLQVPSAMLVYWISSSMFALIQNVFIDRFIPHHLRVKPCKPQRKLGSIAINQQGQ